jgi:hypothetical protein
MNPAQLVPTTNLHDAGADQVQDTERSPEESHHNGRHHCFSDEHR